MLVNSDLTFYESGSYTRHVVRDAYYFDSRSRTAAKNGLQVQDSVIIYLYNTEYVPKAGDIVVNGIIGFEFDNSIAAAVSESMKLFRLSHPDFAVVKTVSNARYGGLEHIEITAR